jgi:hypothetical protein
MTETKILTTVWTDGMGTYQGRCVHCEWRGRWTRSQDGAATDASEHGEWHASRSLPEDAA